MGAASCKNSKLPTQIQPKDDNKNITIGVFGLDDAGKTSAVKVIEGDPTDDVTPTMSSISTTVKNPLNETNDRINKNKNQQNIKIIDVSGDRKFRQKSWSQYYDQIHGLIYVIDTSERERLDENQETLEDLLENEKLKNKPILILANKQDQKGAITSEYDLKRKLDIEKLKTKYKIELCTAIPHPHKNKGDDSIRKGFSWLIRTIDENYRELNARVTKLNTIRTNRKFNRSESDENISENKYTKEKTTDYRSKITSEKLPSLNTTKTKVFSDDDDDIYPSSTNDFNKKKKVLGGITTTNNKSTKKSGDNEPKAFRSTYESFPDETPWTSSSIVKPSKSSDMLPRLYTKPLVTNDTKRRDMSPLVHDTKLYTNGSLSKRNTNSDDEDYFNRQQKSKSTSRFDYSTFPTNKVSSNTKGVTSNIYDDDDNDYNRRTNTVPNKSYNHDDDHDYNKNSQRSSSRSNLNSDYRGTLSKPTDYSKSDDEDDNYSKSKPITRSTYNNDYSNSKSTNRSKYNDDDDDDHHWSSSKPISHSKFKDDDDYPTSKPTIRSKSNDNNYPSSSSKSVNHTRYDDDDDYPSSSSKAVTRSKYDDDDDDDDYTNSSKKNNYSSSYTGNTSRFRSESDDFFTKKGETTTTNRFKKTTDYDS